ncbi:MAG TPA: twin transmembrane helix small protein [Burkholderiales bacterium]|nr:twin transmembrane helix small protein [Burkholderiales bacterium]
MRFLVLLFLVVIVASLGSALYYMIRDKGHSKRTLNALTVRIALSIVLFVLLMVGYATGLIPRGGL